MWEVVPAFIFSYMKKKKQLDIYIDESGDFSLFTKENPLYSVADELREFKKLLDEGIITQEEINKKKQELLNK